MQKKPKNFVISSKSINKKVERLTDPEKISNFEAMWERSKSHIRESFGGDEIVSKSKERQESPTQ